MQPTDRWSFTWQSKRRDTPMLASLLLLLAAALLAGLFFFASQGNPLSLGPLLIFAAWRFLPLLGEKADQHIFIGFTILCFAIDDITQNPWGRELEPLTKQLGILLFQSFGITGIEAFAIFFSLWLLLTRSKAQMILWLHQGLFRILGVGLAIFLASTVAGLYGIATGGDPVVHFIQTRFLHAFPLWTFIGFVLLRDIAFVKRLIFWITLLVGLKSLQGIFMYLLHRDVFSQAEYLVDHYYSLFAVIAMIAMVRYAVHNPNPASIVVNGLGFLILFTTYILNDRRTSYVGVGLAAIMVPVLLPLAWLKRHALKILGLIAFGLFYVAATWNLPAPIGFVGALVQSFGQEAGSEGPSYRDLENANLFNAVVDQPLTGLGYGKEFAEVFKMPDISYVYARYRMIPHNLFLASWAYGGPLTVGALSLVFATMIWLSGRLMRESRDPTLFFIGLLSLFYFMQYFSFVFGDLGLQINRNQMLAGILMGGCYRLLQEYGFDKGA
jgi:hypothetical protein